MHFQMNQRDFYACFFIQLCAFLTTITNLIIIASASLITKKYETIIVFDAGSTGTRCNIFKFQYIYTNINVSTSSVGRWTAENYIFEDRALGLHSSAKEIMQRMLCEATSKISNSSLNFSDISVYLRATAGIRQLSEENKNKIIKDLKEAFETKGPCNQFNIPYDVINILTGKEEAAYAWVGVNFHNIHLLNTPENNVIMSVMDLGGGSTQIAYQKTFDMIQESSTNLAHNNNELNDTMKLAFGGGTIIVNLYVKMYTRAGTKAVRTKMVEYGKKASPCLHPRFSETMNYLHVTFQMVGDSNTNDTDRFDKCFKDACGIVDKIKDFKRLPPQAFRNTTFMGISSFYYIFKLVGLRRNFDTETNEAFIWEVKLAAKTACVNPPYNTTGNEYKAYRCMDICYVLALMTYGYGFPDNALIRVARKAHGLDLGWALGFARIKLEYTLSAHAVASRLPNGGVRINITSISWFCLFLFCMIHFTVVSNSTL